MISINTFFKDKFIKRFIIQRFVHSVSIFYALPTIVLVWLYFYSLYTFSPFFTSITHHSSHSASIPTVMQSTENHSIAPFVTPPIIHNSSLSFASIPLKKVLQSTQNHSIDPFVTPPIIYNSSLSSASIPLKKVLQSTQNHSIAPFVTPPIIYNSSLSSASIPLKKVMESAQNHSIAPYVTPPIIHNSSPTSASIPLKKAPTRSHRRRSKRRPRYHVQRQSPLNSPRYHVQRQSPLNSPRYHVQRQSPINKLTIAKEKLFEKQCDYTNGKWVYDKKGPLYNGTTCNIIKKSLNCIVNGRQDSNYLNWRWKPSECHLPNFDPNTFLKLIKNMNIAFVGDSLANNQMESLICLLSTTSKPELVPHIGTISKWYFPSHNANISLYWSPFLVKGEQRKKEGPPYNKIYLDQVNEMWAKDIDQIDLIVLSFGHWFIDIPSIYYEGDSIIGCLKCHNFKFNYNDIGFYVPMRRALRTALNSIIERKVIKGNGIDVIVRTFSPTHFEGDWDKGGTCSKREPYMSEEKKLEGIDARIRRIEIKEVINAKEKAKKIGLNLEVLDVTNLALLRPDGHAGAYMNPFPFANGIPKYVQNDCVHWCLPGPIDTWNEIFLEMMKNRKDHTQGEM